MHKYNSIVTSLHSKIEKLVLLHQQLEEENRQLIADNDGKVNEIQQLKNRNHWLEAQLRQMEQNTHFPTQNESTSGNHLSLKATIQELRAEIDQCLAQLKSIS